MFQTVNVDGNVGVLQQRQFDANRVQHLGRICLLAGFARPASISPASPVCSVCARDAILFIVHGFVCKNGRSEH